MDHHIISAVSIVRNVRMKLYSFFSAVSLLGTILVFCCSYLLLTSLDKHNMATLSPDRNQHEYNKSATTISPGKKILILAYPRYKDEREENNNDDMYFYKYWQNWIISSGGNYLCGGEFFIFFRAFSFPEEWYSVEKSSSAQYGIYQQPSEKSLHLRGIGN